MKWISFIAIWALFSPFDKAFAGLIAGDLLASGSLNRVGYNNNWQSGFSSSEDTFRLVSVSELDTLPDVFIDDSKTDHSDQLGILVPDLMGSESDVFAVSDTKNSDTNSAVTATWQFDVSAATNSVFSIELAAMGDFERSDYFSLEIVAESLNWRQLFEFEVLESAQQSYQLGSGKSVTLSDPVALEGTMLSNQFQQFSWYIPDTDRLDITFSARADGGQEAVLLRNMKVSGQAVNVPEPSSWLVTLLGCSLLIRRSAFT